VVRYEKANELFSVRISGLLEILWRSRLSRGIEEPKEVMAKLVKKWNYSCLCVLRRSFPIIATFILFC